MISVPLHIGQFMFLTNHSNIHSLWNECRQSSIVFGSLLKHIGQLSCMYEGLLGCWAIGLHIFYSKSACLEILNLLLSLGAANLLSVMASIAIIPKIAASWSLVVIVLLSSQHTYLHLMTMPIQQSTTSILINTMPIMPPIVRAVLSSYSIGTGSGGITGIIACYYALVLVQPKSVNYWELVSNWGHIFYLHTY